MLKQVKGVGLTLLLNPENIGDINMRFEMKRYVAYDNRDGDEFMGVYHSPLHEAVATNGYMYISSRRDYDPKKKGMVEILRKGGFYKPGELAMPLKFEEFINRNIQWRMNPSPLVYSYTMDKKSIRRLYNEVVNLLDMWRTRAKNNRKKGETIELYLSKYVIALDFPKGRMYCRPYWLRLFIEGMHRIDANEIHYSETGSYMYASNSSEKHDGNVLLMGMSIDNYNDFIIHHISLT